jgi:hypothetical protein
MVVGEEGRVDVKESWECWESRWSGSRTWVVWMEVGVEGWENV